MEEIVEQIKALKSEVDSTIEAKASEVADAKLKEATKSVEEKIKEVQSHVDNLDVKLKEGVKLYGEKKKEESFEQMMKSAIKENAESIANVAKGRSFNFQTKAAADMTLANLTGDEQRTYAPSIVAKPNRKLHLADLIQTINIDGGTYTFPKETTSDGSISVQTEGSSKSQIDYDYEMKDVTTDFLAGYAIYSKKMANNIPFLETFLPTQLRRDYLNAEDTRFNTILETTGNHTDSTQVITSNNKVQMLINELAALEGSEYEANGILIKPSDFYDILITEKSTGAGYGLPGIVSIENGEMTINGVPVYKANFLSANKYFVGDWNYVKKISTEGLSVDFSESDGDNFRKNNITARVEAQVGLAVERNEAIIFGDFTAT